MGSAYYRCVVGLSRRSRQVQNSCILRETAVNREQSKRSIQAYARLRCLTCTHNPGFPKIVTYFVARYIQWEKYTRMSVTFLPGRQAGLGTPREAPKSPGGSWSGRRGRGFRRARGGGGPPQPTLLPLVLPPASRAATSPKETRDNEVGGGGGGRTKEAKHTHTHTQ